MSCTRIALPALLLGALHAPVWADEIIVPTQMPLSVALAVAQNDDIITVLPQGSPYIQFPGFAVTNKRVTIRGSTGNPADVVIDGAGLDIVLRMTNADGSVIEGITLQNGRGGAAAESSGAGLYLSNSDITIRDCIIRDNVIPGADGNGVGIYGTQSSTVIERCVIQNNTCDSSSADGLGIYFNAGSHILRDTIVRDNRIPTGTSLADTSIGGGFYADNGSAIITRCRFENNRAGFGGGMGVSGSMTMTIDECVFADNEARYGGGFYNTGAAGGGTNRFRNSLFDANHTDVNDAAFFLGKPSVLTNLTIVNNVASNSYIIGGGTATGAVVVDNCIIWGNTYNTTNGLMAASSPEIVRRCILQQAFSGAAGSGDNRVVNPLFVNAGARDFRLQRPSPAIDAGDTNLYFGPFADLDARPRVVDDPDTDDTGFTLSGPVIDIGAYELQVAPPPSDCPPDFNRDGTLNSQDFFEFLNAFFTGC